jgi:hypothetical protein
MSTKSSSSLKSSSPPATRHSSRSSLYFPDPLWQPLFAVCPSRPHSVKIIATVHIERNHHVGKAEAIRKINALLDDLMRQRPPAGVTIKEVSRNWSDDTLQFSVQAKKGFLGTTLSGVLRVNDNSVVLDCDLPGLVAAFVPEDKIRDAVHQQLDHLFPA